MKENKSLHFLHNYHGQEEGRSVLPEPPGILILSGVKTEYIRLVTGRAHALFSFGIWNFWDAQDGRAGKVPISLRGPDWMILPHSKWFLMQFIFFSSFWEWFLQVGS